MVYHMKILFLTTDNSLITGPQRGEKSRIGFKSSLFWVKLIICKHMIILLSYTYLGKK